MLSQELKPELNFFYDYNNAGTTTSIAVDLQNGGFVTDGHFVSTYHICTVSEIQGVQLLICTIF